MLKTGRWEQNQIGRFAYLTSRHRKTKATKPRALSLSTSFSLYFLSLLSLSLPSETKIQRTTASVVPLSSSSSTAKHRRRSRAKLSPPSSSYAFTITFFLSLPCCSSPSCPLEMPWWKSSSSSSSPSSSSASSPARKQTPSARRESSAFLWTRRGESLHPRLERQRKLRPFAEAVEAVSSTPVTRSPSALDLVPLRSSSSPVLLPHPLPLPEYPHNNGGCAAGSGCAGCRAVVEEGSGGAVDCGGVVGTDVNGERASSAAVRYFFLLLGVATLCFGRVKHLMY